MATTIKLKNGSGAPLAGDLVQGEPALDLTNKRLYTEDSGGTVIEVGTNPTSLTTGTFTSTGIDDNATSTAITIDSSENVGINTASPSSVLDVRLTGATGDVAEFHNNAGFGVRFNVEGNGGTNTIFSESNQSLALGTNGSGNPRVTIDSSGNVGIGETSAQAKLHVTSSSSGLQQWERSANKIKFEMSTIASGGYGFYDTVAAQYDAYFKNGNVGIGTTSPANKLDVNGILQSSSVGNYLQLQQSSTDGYINMTGSGGLNFRMGSGFDTRMTIDSSGNVGIGAAPVATGYSGVSTTLYVENTSAAAVTVDSSSTGRAYSLVSDATGNFSVFDEDASAVRMRINSSGNVGIGTASPTSKLHVRDVIRVSTSGTGDTATDGTVLSVGASGEAYLYNYESQPLIFATSATERMRLDSSGNLLVGKTSSSFTVAGVRVRGDTVGIIEATSANNMLVLNRLTSDGAMATFYKDGTTVGSIGVAGSDIYHGSGDTGLKYYNAGDAIHPYNPSTLANRDNAIDLGMSSIRFDDIYATNGTIQTSDANEKQDIEALSEAETRVAVAAKALLRKFRWKSAVRTKSHDARIHFGIIAQDLQAAFEAEGLDAGEYGMFIHSTWTDEETGEERSRMGVRYSELLAFIIAAI